MSPENIARRPYRRYKEPVHPDPETFPQDKIAGIVARGNQRLSPFWVLSQFGLGFARTKEDRDAVLMKIAQSKYAATLEILDTPKGKRIRASQTPELLSAIQDEYTLLISHLPVDFRRKLARAFRANATKSAPKTT